MTFWTLSAQLGTGGREIATELAARADVRLLDRQGLATLAHELDPQIDPDSLNDLDERLGGRLAALALSLAVTAGVAEAFSELQLRQTLPSLGREVMREAARQPAVVLAPAAFAAMGDHPAAIHVRLHAPLGWRLAEVQRSDLLSRERAEKLVRHDDHRQRSWVRELYHVDLDEPQAFSLAIDASRLSRERIVHLLLAAAGRGAAGGG